MPQIINSNIASLTAQRHLNSSQNANSTALERLSSGLRINAAKDDAAGLAISTKFESQIKGLNVAIRNAGDGVSLTQTAEGALGTMTENLQRMRELAVQSSNSTNSDSDRVALQAEVAQLMLEVKRTSEETNFNGRNLLDGSFDGTFQIGSNAGNTVGIEIAELTIDRLGASAQSGVSSIGTDAALANGDLTINGVAISGSKSGDDPASFQDGDRSAIAKAAAINAKSDETGVRAETSNNVSTGSEMVGLAGGVTTFLLNGVSLNATTSLDTAATRASITDTINNVSTQTGVTAINTGSDADGIELTASDGRNITLSFDTGAAGANLTNANFASATGLMGGQVVDATTATLFSNTVEGGFTLIADGDTKEMVVGGGNGTGQGNIENSGLVAGTYARAMASSVSDSEFESTSGTLMGLDGSSINTIGATTTLDIAGAVDMTVVQGTTSFYAQNTAGSPLGVIATALAASGAAVSAWEDVNYTYDHVSGAVGGTIGFTAGGATVIATLEAGDGNAELAQKFNAIADGGSGLEINASFNAVTGLIDMNIRNYSNTEFSMVSDAIGTTYDIATTNIAVAGATNVAQVISGDLAWESTNGVDLTVSLTDIAAGADLLAVGPVMTTTGGTVNGLDAGDLEINGVSIGAAIPSTDNASATTTSTGTSIISSSKERSGIAVAAAINLASDATGVTATAQPTVLHGGDGTNVDATVYAVNDTAGLFLNGVSLGTVTLQDDGTTAVDTDKARLDALTMINGASGQTGVTATDNGTSLSLTAADGRNISLAINNPNTQNPAVSTTLQKGSSIGALMGLDMAVDGIGEGNFTDYAITTGAVALNGTAEAYFYETTYSGVKLASASAITISAGSNGADEVAALGMTVGIYGNGSDGTFLKDVDISTFEGAQAAITALDNALDSISAQRSELGAMQNRFESTSTNLQVNSENLSAANSQIRDADFATETAELSRTQVLQQAGISILAQANQRPQQVLSLLG
ncbi:flagellin N-terminal helical domain-containing protein [Reinekea forsetii]|jgi:flagellin|uniref:Flagellin n=1 Tax=Reinekea forsetii TaxID=1336806 RepID=A0A2K8KR96_9GAMM|nr:flagellin [Reinekea forsetii]ATX77258.1 flagellin domain protein [Reinekea forsetii]